MLLRRGNPWPGRGTVLVLWLPTAEAVLCPRLEAWTRSTAPSRQYHRLTSYHKMVRCLTELCPCQIAIPDTILSMIKMSPRLADTTIATHHQRIVHHRYPTDLHSVNLIISHLMMLHVALKIRLLIQVSGPRRL